MSVEAFTLQALARPLKQNWKWRYMKGSFVTQTITHLQPIKRLRRTKAKIGIGERIFL